MRLIKITIKDHQFTMEENINISTMQVPAESLQGKVLAEEKAALSKEKQEKESQEIFAPYKDYSGKVHRVSRQEAFFRRIFDISVALPTLVLSMPIMILIGILVRLDSPGPALFLQIRMTKNRRNNDQGSVAPNKNDRRKKPMAGCPFLFIKFRTMYVDAKDRFPHLYEYKYSKEEIAKIKFKTEDDPRVTRIGRFLRKSSLDELPNFLNVLLGDMSLNGPRPEIPEMSSYYNDEQLKKFMVPAGVTGPSQIGGRGNLSFQDTANLDAAYATNRSIKGDIIILVKTVLAVIKCRGAS